MATPAQRPNTWILDEWYDQAVAGTQGEYTGVGSIWGCGYTVKGRGGWNNPSNLRYSSPTQLPGNWVTVTSAGQNASLGIKGDGTLWGWGAPDDHNPLGLNSETKRSSPTQIGTGSDWAYVTSGTGQNSTVMAVKTDNTLWMWGSNEYGLLGFNQPTSSHRSSPTQLPGTTWSTNPQHLSIFMNAQAIKTDGTMWAWGNAGGTPTPASPGYASMSSPCQIGTETTWDKIGKVYSNFCGIKTDGTLWTSGFNQYGELGQSDFTQYSSSRQVGTETTWKHVAFGDNWGSGVKTDGTMWVWGKSGAGQLGLNDRWSEVPECLNSPTQLGTDTNWSDVISSQTTLVAVKTDASLWMIGYGPFGAFGNNQNATSYYSSPVQVPGTWNITTNRSAKGDNFSWFPKYA